MPASRPLTELIDAARAESAAMVQQMTAAFRSGIPGYRPGEGLAEDEIRANLGRSLTILLDRMGGTSEDWIVAYDDSLRARLESGIPLTSLLHANRLSAGIVWQEMAQLVRTDEQKDALIDVALWLFTALDLISLRTQAISQEIELRDARRNEQIRAAMLDVVLCDHPRTGTDFWQALSALGIPRSGQFVVVASVTEADSPPGAQTDIEALIAPHGAVEGAWFRLKPHAQFGLVSFRQGRVAAVDEIADKIAATTPVLLGVSSPFAAITECFQAFSQAQVAAKATSTVSPVIRYNRDVLPILMASSPDAAAAVVAATLGPLLDLDPPRRDPLMATMRIWLQHRQSMSAAATELHCHRNTVAYRLRRFAEVAGGSLADNAWLTQVALAVHAPYS